VPLIDQRILIAAPADAVWQYLATPNLIPRWHKGCRQVSILSTRVGVVGTRRRITDPDGRSTIEEITQWLENLGYEYVMLEGSYREYRGRLRLQPISEGTWVNWTFEYQAKGVLSGIRSFLGARRRIEAMMSASLKQLRRLVESTGVKIDPEKQNRFAVRAAPNWEERAARGGVMSSVEGKPAPRAAHIALPHVDEDKAAITEDGDTVLEIVPLKTPPVPQPSDPTPPPPKPEPSFVAALPQASSTPTEIPSRSQETNLADTKPRKPKGLNEMLGAQASPSLPPTVPSVRVPPPDAREGSYDPNALTVPVSLVAPKEEASPPPPSAPPAPLERTQTYAVPPVNDALPPEMRKTPPRGIPVPTPKQMFEAEGQTIDKDIPPPTHTGDTGEISIWQVFGMAAPSERTRTDLNVLIASLQPTPIKSAKSALSRRAGGKKARADLTQKIPPHKRRAHRKRARSI